MTGGYIHKYQKNPPFSPTGRRQNRLSAHVSNHPFLVSRLEERLAAPRSTATGHLPRLAVATINRKRDAGGHLQSTTAQPASPAGRLLPKWWCCARLVVVMSSSRTSSSCTVVCGGWWGRVGVRVVVGVVADEPPGLQASSWWWRRSRPTTNNGNKQQQGAASSQHNERNNNNNFQHPTPPNPIQNTSHSYFNP